MVNYKPFYEDKIQCEINPAENNIEYELITDKKHMFEVMTEYKDKHDSEHIAVDLETEDLNHLINRMIGASLAFNRHKCFYIPFQHVVGENAPLECFEGLNQMMYNTTGKVFFYNSRFDLRHLEHPHTLEDPDCFGGLTADLSKVSDMDTAVIVFNADTNMGKYAKVSRPDGEKDKKGLTLDYVKEKVFGWPRHTFDDACGDAENLAHVDPEEVTAYAGEDALATYLIPVKFGSIWKEVQFPIELDNQFNRTVKDMEETPVHVDLDHVQQIHDKVDSKVSKVEKETFELIGKEINFNSYPQIRETLQELGLDTGEKTDAGNMATGESALENITDQHRFPQLVLEWREFGKTKKSYTKPVFRETREKGQMVDGRSNVGKMFFNFNTTKVQTGRLSASQAKNNDFFSKFNCQSITKPDKTYLNLVEGDSVLGYDIEKADNEEEADYKGYDPEFNIRRFFIPPEGWVWLHVDFSGQEMRIAANESKDPKMIDAFTGPEDTRIDLHQNTADNVLGEFGDYSRAKGKRCNFAIFYGAQEYRLSQDFNMSESDAEKLLKLWWDQYPKAARWIKRQKRKGEKQGYVKNAFGRLRWVRHWFNSGDFGKQKFAERTCLNAPIQGFGAELIKLGTYNVWDRVMTDFPDAMRQELQCHDEHNWSIKPESYEMLQEILDRTMDEMEVEIPDHPVPYKCDADIGDSYGRLCPIEKSGSEWKFLGEHKFNVAA